MLVSSAALNNRHAAIVRKGKYLAHLRHFHESATKVSPCDSKSQVRLPEIRRIPFSLFHSASGRPQHLFNSILLHELFICLFILFFRLSLTHRALPDLRLPVSQCHCERHCELQRMLSLVAIMRAMFMTRVWKRVVLLVRVNLTLMLKPSLL